MRRLRFVHNLFDFVPLMNERRTHVVRRAVHHHKSQWLKPFMPMLLLFPYANSSEKCASAEAWWLHAPNLRAMKFAAIKKLPIVSAQWQHLMQTQRITRADKANQSFDCQIG
jgi:hypothetical protein